MTIETKIGIGASMPRREDARLLSGRGRFTDDLLLPRMAHAAMFGSPHAHARIVRIDTAAAAALKGVLGVFTGKDLAGVMGPMPTLATPPVVQHCVAFERARHVGEPIAVVVAESRYIAEDAVALIEVEFEELPVVVDPEAAVKSTGNAVLHPEFGSNIVHQSRHAWGPVEEAFSQAAHVVCREFRWPRVGPQPLETCAAIADYDAITGHFQVWANMSQQSVIGPKFAKILHTDMAHMTFHIRDVGGSFGGKATLYHVPLLAAVLSREIGRPVKFVEDRAEHMTAGNQHASDRLYKAELAINAENRFTGLRLRVLDDMGAYFLIATGAHGNALAQATGPYQIDALEYDLTCVVTNKTQQAPYRGFGGEVGNFVLERMVDAAAAELGVHPVELRRRNFIANDQFPYRTPVGNLYDSGDYTRVLDAAMALADEHKIWDMPKHAAPGKRIGIGLATVNERSVLSMTEFWLLDADPIFPQSSSPESVQVSIHADGTVNVSIFAPHWGNSPETMAAQITAHELMIPPEWIRVVQVGTDGGMLSKGPAGSRYTAMLAGAILGACTKLKQRILAIGAHRLGVLIDEAVYADGQVTCKADSSRAIALPDIARASHSHRLDFPGDDQTFRSGLTESFTCDHPRATLPTQDRTDLGVFYPIVGHACHIAVVEVDEATQSSRVIRYVAVHDAGTIVNPRLVDGQIRGGIAQGIGTALYEQYLYDDEGQLVNATLADYGVPTSEEIPDMILGHVETPSPFTAYGIKGCGEGGRLAAMPALAAAFDDAYRDSNLYVDRLPMTPSALHTKLSQLKPV
ncbi:MAG: xanthine dehydrogenase family protein molybdopterin-binding subunit [Rhizobiaceae bacterium]|nr:xanthine dehydrogenase family protein molybdopterin-binding subunit [Rhizobiaceae bacterium]